MRPTFEKASDFINSFWKYYKILEADVLSVEKYVAIEENNFKTNSNEFIKLYQTICGEVDVVAKVLCKLLNESSRAEKIDEYQNEITNKLPLFAATEVSIETNEIMLFCPWKSWMSAKKPMWWTLYNKVKHERLTICTDIEEYRNKKYYQTANLENVLNSLAALFILEFYCILVLCYKTNDYWSLIDCFRDSVFYIPEKDKFYYKWLGQDIIEDEKIKNVIDNYIK